MRALKPIGFLVFSFWLSVFAAGCGTNQSSADDIAPAAPRLVERSPDDFYAQRGIRPVPTATDNQYRVRIEWYPNTEPDVAGYRIWRRREDTDYAHWQIIRDLRYGTNLDRAPILVFLDAGDNANGFPADLLRPDQPGDTVSTRGFKWWVQAYDEANNRSVLSDSLYYRLVNNPRNLSVERPIPGRYELHWQFTVNDDPDDLSYYYMIRVYQSAGGPDSVMWWKQVNRYEDNPFVVLNYDGTARPFVADDTYVWQLNVVVVATDTSSRVPAGSAAYTTFLYQD